MTFLRKRQEKTYDKEIHKNYLIDKYIETLVNNRVKIEEYLFARDSMTAPAGIHHHNRK